jgi:DNA-binding NtrC family response regulator
VIPIALPPLRERPEDVLPLARLFLERWSAELSRPVSGWSDEVERHLERDAWPGNVRELENTIERGVVLARGERIELDDLLVDAEAPSSDATAVGEPPRALHDFLETAAADRIRLVLAETGGVKVEAARRLGIDRTTLYRLMRKYAVTSGDE